MKFTYKALAIAITLPFAASQSMAAPSYFGDARAFAMGGTGVASASPTAASFFNPALVASKHDDAKDGFGIVFPSINVRVSDEEEVVKRIDDYQNNDTFETLQIAIDALNDNPNNVAAALAVVSAAESFNDELSALDEDTVKFELGIGTALVVPGQSLGVAVFFDTAIKGTVTLNYEDEELYESYRDAALKIASKAPDAPSSLDDLTVSNIESSGIVIAAAKAEVGITLAHEFEIADRAYAVGISPKVQIFKAYDYTASLEGDLDENGNVTNKFDDQDFDAADLESEETAFNLDIGVATHFGDENEWTVGFSGMNIIPVEFNTSEAPGVSAARGHLIEIDPLYRIGLSHSGEWHTVAVDLDLTENKAFGFEDDTQFISVGGEFDAFDTMQLRAGIRHNLANDNGREGVHENTQFTAGLGLSPLGIHMDISGLYADGQYGAAAELGFTF